MRLQEKNFDDIFVVVEKHGEGSLAKAYTLSDLSGRRHNLGFSQPVAAHRLTPVELMPLSHPDESAPTRVCFNRLGVQRYATIVSQTVDGLVNVQYDDDPVGHTVTVDLTRESYNWL